MEPHVTTVNDLLSANLMRVFDNRDAADRRRAIDEIYAESVAFTDPEGTVTGRDELDRRAGALLAKVPADFRFAEAGLRYTDASTGALAWTFGPVDQPVARGLDIITVQDGRIVALHTLLHDD